MEMETVQSVVVMRHGDRIDNADPRWTTTAARPWDPPITDGGRTRSRCTGLRLRLGPPTGRAFVSPFLRCVQTAAEAVAALCAAGDNADIDPSKVKVSGCYCHLHLKKKIPKSCDLCRFSDANLQIELIGIDRVWLVRGDERRRHQRGFDPKRWEMGV